MNTQKIILILAFSIFIAACATEKPIVSDPSAPSTPATMPIATAAPNDELAAAKANYTKQKCVVCHGESGAGGKNIVYGDIQIDEVPSFQNPKVAAEPDAEYVHKIERGGDGMPKYKDKLSKEEINALVRFIRAEFQGK